MGLTVVHTFRRLEGLFDGITEHVTVLQSVCLILSFFYANPNDWFAVCLVEVVWSYANQKTSLCAA